MNAQLVQTTATLMPLATIPMAHSSALATLDMLEMVSHVLISISVLSVKFEKILNQFATPMQRVPIPFASILTVPSCALAMSASLETVLFVRMSMNAIF